MSRADIPQVHDIARHSFSTPWQAGSFEHELANKDAILHAAVVDDKIIGYICLRTILDAAHIMDMAVISGLRRTGLGSMLLRSALQELRRTKQDIHLVTLEVRESNIAAIKLYETFGFKEIGRRKSYYKKPLEDAVIMETDMNEAPSSLTIH
jgi:ribosomal-protein-alanine N-acetyltransferase